MNYDRFVLACLGICLLQPLLVAAVANAEEYRTISGSVQLAKCRSGGPGGAGDTVQPADTEAGDDTHR